MDTKGPLPVSSRGCKYLVTVTDEATGNRAVGAIKSKSDAAAFVISIITLWEKQVQAPGFHVVQRVRTDNGTEFMGILNTYLRARGIIHELSAPYTAEQIGAAERQNRTVFEPARAMLADAKLPQSMWVYAAQCACVLLNSSVSENKTKSPHELFHGTPAPTSDLRVFGCHAWVLKPSPTIAALGSRVRAKGIFVGYPTPLGSRQYLVLIDGKVVRSSDVQFHECSQIASVAPVIARQGVSVAVPTPELSQHNNPDDDDENVRAPREHVVEYDAAAHVPEQVVLQDVPVHPQPLHVPIVYADHIDWPVQQMHNIVPHLVPVQVAPVEHVVQEVVVAHEEHDANVPYVVHQEQQDGVHQEQQQMPQTHAGRARRDRNPEWRAQHIPGYEPALSAAINFPGKLPVFQKQRKPGWGTSRGVKQRLALHVSSHRMGMQRPDLAWRPVLQPVLEHSDMYDASDDVSDVFSSSETCSVEHSCSSLHEQNKEMSHAMRAAISSPRNFPRPGLIRTVDGSDVVPCLRTSVPCMPCEELPRVLGDMSVMPKTIEEALARPNHAKWREALEIELGAMNTMKVWQVAALPDGASAVGCRMIFEIKQPSGRYKCILVAQGFSQVHGQDYGETYAPVAAMQTLRVFWATCAHFGLTIR